MYCEPAQHTGNSKSPMIKFYNATKSGVDNLYHLVRFYLCKRKSRHWLYSLFMNIVDVICVDAYILYKKDRSNIVCYAFLTQVAHQLMASLMSKRSIGHRNNRVRSAYSVFMAMEPPTQASECLNRGSCYICPRPLDKKTDVKCHTSKCGKFMCLEHRITCCRDSLGK